MEFTKNNLISDKTKTNFEDLMKALLDNELQKMIDNLFDNEKTDENNTLGVA